MMGAVPEEIVPIGSAGLAPAGAWPGWKSSAQWSSSALGRASFVDGVTLAVDGGRVAT